MNSRAQPENRPDSLAAGKHTVTHGAVDGFRSRVFRRKQSLERRLNQGLIYLEKIHLAHAREPAGMEGSGAGTRQPDGLGGFIFRFEGLRRNLAV